MKRKHTSPARTAMKLLCTLLGIVLAVLLTATVYFGPLSGLNPQPSPGAAASTTEGFAALLSSKQSAEGKTINILLIGQDRREGEGRTRSDSMILCTFIPSTNRLILTSFLRDLYVPIPGYGSNRINAAYAYGGSGLLQQTLEENFGVKIDGNVEVDFNQFAQIIDQLGGVQIELRQDEADLINEETGSSLSSGQQILRGDQALAYSRIRKLDPDGDFSRTNRQRYVLQALFKAYKTAQLPALLKTTLKILPMITTDMSHGELLRYAMALFPHLTDAEIISQRVPADGQFTDQVIDGMSVLVADMDAVREKLRKTLSENSTESAF